MDNLDLSVKYAKAFFNNYGSQIQEEVFWKVKKVAAKLVKNKAALNAFSLYRATEQQVMINIILRHFELETYFGNLLILLQKHKRLLLFPSILNEIAENFLNRNNLIFFKITSYPKLVTSQQGQAVAYLQKSTGQNILYQLSEDPGLIAGIKMQSKQLLYEDSISCRLQKIHRKLVRQN